MTCEPTVTALDDVDESRGRAAERTHTASPIDSLEVRLHRRQPRFQRWTQRRVCEKRHRRGVEAARRFDATVADSVAAWQERVGPNRAGIPRSSEALERGSARWIDGGDVFHGGAEQLFSVVAVERRRCLGRQRHAARPALATALRRPRQSRWWRIPSAPALEHLAVRREARRQRAPPLEEISPRLAEISHASPLNARSRNVFVAGSYSAPLIRRPPTIKPTYWR